MQSQQMVQFLDKSDSQPVNCWCGAFPHKRFEAVRAALWPMMRETMKKAALDAADIRILSVLQRHGPLSKSKLADMVGLSPSPCWARLDRLKKSGLILGYRSDLNLAKIADFTKVIVTVSLNSHRKVDFDRFEDYVRLRSEITDCVSTGGGMDYVMTVVTSNLQDFQDLMEAMLDSELAIERYVTYIVTRQIKEGQPDIIRLASKRDSWPQFGA